MPEEWMVRVAGKEYGPVDTDTLREWKAEGRLIAENEVRRVGEQDWMPASGIEKILEPAEISSHTPEVASQGARNWRQIIAETFRIYRGGFGRFVLFGLISAVPMFALQWTLPRVEMPALSGVGDASMTWPALQPIALVMLLVFLVTWPISTAGMQFVADDILHGRERSLGSQFRAAVARWGQMLSAAILVYGSYLFWFCVPFAVLVALAGSGQISIVGALLFVLVGCFMVYMNARLFINFLFWQQTGAFRSHGALSALRESKELARGVTTGPKMDRPLYRGATVASVWLLLILVLTVGVQLPFMLARFIGVANPEEAMALARTLAESKTPDTFMLLANIASAALGLLMQPLLAASFVVLYYDARARSGKHDDDEVSSD